MSLVDLISLPFPLHSVGGEVRKLIRENLLHFILILFLVSRIFNVSWQGNFFFWGQWVDDDTPPYPICGVVGGRSWAWAWESVSMCACQASHSTSQLAADAFQLQPRKISRESRKIGKAKDRDSERDRERERYISIETRTYRWGKIRRDSPPS